MLVHSLSQPDQLVLKLPFLVCSHATLKTPVIRLQLSNLWTGVLIIVCISMSKKQKIQSLWIPDQPETDACTTSNRSEVTHTCDKCLCQNESATALLHPDSGFLERNVMHIYFYSSAVESVLHYSLTSCFDNLTVKCKAQVSGLI